MKRLEAGTLAALPGIAHGFFGREGGVSSGLYDSLNCGPGSKDVPASVMENRRRVATALAPEAPSSGAASVRAASAASAADGAADRFARSSVKRMNAIVYTPMAEYTATSEYATRSSIRSPG